jgi:hypothetical protein
LDRAVEETIAPADPYSVSGELEEMRHKIGRLVEVVGALTEVLDRQGLLLRDDIRRLTDGQYAVEE